MLFHCSYIIPPFGCFRKGAAISFITKNEKPLLTTSHFSLWDFFYSPFFLEQAVKKDATSKDPHGFGMIAQARFVFNMLSNSQNWITPILFSFLSSLFSGKSRGGRGREKRKVKREERKEQKEKAAGDFFFLQQAVKKDAIGASEL